MRAYMEQASRIVLSGFTVRTDVVMVKQPDRYMDERGAEFLGHSHEPLMKPKYPYPLEKYYSHPIPWDEELFEPRIQGLLDTCNLSNMDRCMLRLRSNQARELGDARIPCSRIS